MGGRGTGCAESLGGAEGLGGMEDVSNGRGNGGFDCARGGEACARGHNEPVAIDGDADQGEDGRADRSQSGEEVGGRR